MKMVCHCHFCWLIFVNHQIQVSLESSNAARSSITPLSSLCQLLFNELSCPTKPKLNFSTALGVLTKLLLSVLTSSIFHVARRKLVKSSHTFGAKSSSSPFCNLHRIFWVWSPPIPKFRQCRGTNILSHIWNKQTAKCCYLLAAIFKQSTQLSVWRLQKTDSPITIMTWTS